MRFLPGQPYDRIPDVVALGDICVLLQSDTSLLARYQVPAKLVDALAAGLLVLAQPTAGMMDFVERGVVVPTSAELLAQTLSRWLNDESAAQAKRAAGRDYFRTHLSAEVCRPLLKCFGDNSRSRPDPKALFENPKQQGLFDSLGGWEMFRPWVPVTAIKTAWVSLEAKRRDPVPTALPEVETAARLTPTTTFPLNHDARVVVYSVLVGDYEAVKEPEFIDPSVRYILFTDNPDLKSDRWEVMHFDTLGLSPRRASRLPKLVPHKYLPEHDVSIYLDASLKFIERNVRHAAEEALQGLEIAGYPHFERNCLFEEIEVCLSLGKSDEERSEALRKRLKKEQYPKSRGLLENAFLVRRDTSIMRQINELWFKEYMVGPERDQFSLMYVLWRARIPHAVIGNAPNFRKSPHVRWTKHHGATACRAHPDMNKLAEHFDFLAESSPAALAKKARSVVEKISAGKDAPKISKHQLQTFIAAVNALGFQDAVLAEESLTLMGQALFPDRPMLLQRRFKRPLKLAYIAGSKMPSIAANNVHVMKICSAFSEIGTDVTLYAEQEIDHSDGSEDIYRRFATRTVFPMVLHHENAASKKLGFFSLVRRAIDDGNNVIFTRSSGAAVFAALAGIPVYLEVHEIKDDAAHRTLQFLARCDALKGIVVISQPLKSMMRPFREGLEDRVVVLHDGADPAPALLHKSSEGFIS
ncbi:glycosyltransferase domain-containing protein, partial [Limnospira sp. PMC 289.06]|uniref:glycosyltransferase domain-containing protein n=1 Tax=Limnospira sp. PMC 289.06 TaxID=2981094 RepID=UPI0028E15EED|nr:DUF616 domain-containing protein [Limnospira sp. PMC 289.06]